MGRVLYWLAVLAAAVTVAVTDVPAAFVFAPLLAIAILWVGLGMLRSLHSGAGMGHVPTGDPEPLDPAVERITYWCAGCGAEVLLLVRGTEAPPRHCGERMHERAELAPQDRNGAP